MWLRLRLPTDVSGARSNVFVLCGFPFIPLDLFLFLFFLTTKALVFFYISCPGW